MGLLNVMRHVFFPPCHSQALVSGMWCKERSGVCFSRESIDSLNTSRSLDSRLCSPGGMKAGLRLNCNGQQRLSPASELFREPQHVGEFPQAYASKRSLNVQVASGNLCVVYSLCNSERRSVPTVALLHACLSCSLRANMPAQPTRVPPPPVSDVCSGCNRRLRIPHTINVQNIQSIRNMGRGMVASLRLSIAFRSAWATQGHRWDLPVSCFFF